MIKRSIVYVCLALCAALCVALCVGCGANQKTVPTDTVKTGYAVVSTAAKSTDAGEKDGLVQADTNVVAVTVGDNGKIIKCVIDAIQTKINFSVSGKITTSLDTKFKTKMELGTNYGMAKASSIGKEWSAQAAALADYVQGKTIAEVKGIAVNEKGVPTQAELASSVTVSITDQINAIERAVNNAKDIGTGANDTLGVGAVTEISKSKDAGEKDGLAQAYTTYAVVTFGADGKITACVIDGSQTNVSFSASGKITSDIKAPVKTKNELGGGYGMKAVSTIGKEWFEQADAFSNYAVGKSVEQVKEIAVNGKGAPKDSELNSSVTVAIADFKNAIEKAKANSR